MNYANHILSLFFFSHLREYESENLPRERDRTRTSSTVSVDWGLVSLMRMLLSHGLHGHHCNRNDLVRGRRTA